MYASSANQPYYQPAPYYFMASPSPALPETPEAIEARAAAAQAEADKAFKEAEAARDAARIRAEEEAAAEKAREEEAEALARDILAQEEKVKELRAKADASARAAADDEAAARAAEEALAALRPATVPVVPYMNTAPVGGYYTYLNGASGSFLPSYTPTYAPASTTYRYINYQPTRSYTVGSSPAAGRSFVASGSAPPLDRYMVYR